MKVDAWHSCEDLVMSALTDADFEEFSEPKFKYKRIQNDLAKIFVSDAASCFVVHSKFLAVGTQRGRVYVFDHAGNKISGNNIPPHAVDVNQISIDASGEYLASCANDGKIVVHGLCGSSDFSQIVSTDRPIKSVALDPNFGRLGSGQIFITGDRCLTLHEKGLLGSNRQSIIYDGKERDGWIHAISWHDIYILFANESGVRLFDKSQKLIITHVNRRHDLALRSELYPARLIWFNDHSFAIGWADRITVCSIKENKNFGPTLLSAAANFASKTQPMNNKYVEINNMWELAEHYVSGISYTNTLPSSASKNSSLNELSDWQELVLFCTCKPEIRAENEFAVDAEYNSGTSVSESDSLLSSQQPRILLVEPISLQEYALLNEDIIEVNKTLEKPAMCHQCHLAGVPDENSYFILTPHDMIQIYPCTADDHVEWLIDNQLFRKALEFAKQHAKQLTKQSVYTVGRHYLDFLIGQKRDFAEAARLCPEVCGRRKDVWEEYTSQFERHNQLKYLAPVLPVHDPQLEPECYQSVLLDFLKDDFENFKNLVFKWSPDLYRTGALINDILRRLYNDQDVGSENHVLLLSTLAVLYTHERSYERALEIYLKLRDRSIFPLIDNCHLFSMVKNRIQELMIIDTDLAVRLLLENSDKLPAATIMTQLSRQPKLQLAYLDKLFARGEGKEFADLAISLYAEYNRPKLLPFLRNCEYYKLDKALETCKSCGLIPESVFLLARGGNRAEALRMIMHKTKNVDMAINFCKEHDDPDLWSDLIDYCSTDARFVTILMQNLGGQTDPRLLIRKISPGLKIDGLKRSLIKLLKDYNSQIELQQGCRTILFSDCHRTLGALFGVLNSGISIRLNYNVKNSKPSQQCALCSNSLISSDDVDLTLSKMENVIFLHCGHNFHEHCFVKTKFKCFRCRNSLAKKKA